MIFSLKLICACGLIATAQYFLPAWVQILIGIAAALVAGGVIWKKLIQPLAKCITLLDIVLPILSELAKNFKDTPHAFAVLNDIIREFRTDSGSTLRDVVNRLEKAANENRSVSEVLKANAEAARMLSEQDRKQLARLVELLNRVDAKQRENIKTVDRLEAGASMVAIELDAAQTRAEKVEGEPGAAADAAVRRTQKE